MPTNELKLKLRHEQKSTIREKMPSQRISRDLRRERVAARPAKKCVQNKRDQI